MGYRQINDRFGHLWDVWEVVPAASPGDAPPAGWLAFQSRHEKRRLATFPADWSSLPDDELLALLEVATPAGKPTRLIE